MNIIQWIQSVPQRPLGYLASLFKGGEESLPLESDPVGEFLESKKRGVNLAEDGVNEEPPAAGVPTKDVGAPIESRSKSAVSTERIEVATQPVVGRLESPVQADSKVDTLATALPDGAKEKVSQSEIKASEAAAETKVEANALKSGSQKIEAANTPPANSPQEDENIKSVLEIFRSEELALDTTTSLSKELGDMSVYSLLEESKQIAQIAKKVKKPCPE
jgi:hypothetical protein